ncbi:hypothetical protein [Micromonospora aurantiaca (nom. illeg.)]|uniref:hypothetical protein n=1 Tax=Micromonospora aurantiaca (nom. illeg.) TaxID=47850 RepID=UPI003F4A7F1D
MIPQGYELWLAEDLDDGEEPLIGRVIGWHVPREIANTEDASHIAPVVAYDGRRGRPGEIGLATADVYFGATKEEVTKLIAEHIERKQQPEVEAQMKEMEAQARRRAWDMARDDAETGDLSSVRESVANQLQRFAPRLRPIAESAEWTLTGPREIEVKVPRKENVDFLPIYERHISRTVDVVLGEGWTVTVARAGFLRGRR